MLTIIAPPQKNPSFDPMALAGSFLKAKPVVLMRQKSQLINKSG
jgi:hypothetical protein